MSCQPLSCVCGKISIHHRFVLSIMLFFGILCCYSMRLCLHIALTKIAMHIPPSRAARPEVCPGNNTQILRGGAFNWSQEVQGVILLSFFPGYIVTHIPGGMLAQAVGGKYILQMCVSVSVIITLLTPFVIRKFYFVVLVITRVILGLAQGPLFPTITILLAAWIPRQERSTLAGLVYSGVFLGSVTGNLLSGLIMTYTKSWPLVFYTWGGISAVWCVFFQIFCYSRPDLHPFITEKEKEFLQNEIGPIKKFKTPWGRILKDNAVVAIVILQIGHDWISYIMVVDFPKFFHDVLVFDVGETGMITAASFLIMWISSVTFGWISDYIINRKKLTMMQMRKLYTILSNFGPTVFCVISSYVGCDKITVVALIWTGVVLQGPWLPGPKCSTLDITLNFSGIVMALSNGSGVLSGILVPYVVAVVAPDGTLSQWRIVFWIAVAVGMLSSIPYFIWGRAERREWDYTDNENVFVETR